MQKQYHKRTTLRSKSSTIKGLLNAPDPEKMQERDAEYLALTIAHLIHGTSEPLGMTVAQRYDVP